jgi:hypothetical protein
LHPVVKGQPTTKQRKPQQNKSKAKSTCPKWHFGQIGHGEKNHGGGVDQN